MRKILPILVIGIFVLSGLGAVALEQTETVNVISDKIEISKPKIIENENFLTLELTEANSNYWGEGKPFLPVVSKIFTFDFGTKIDNVEIILSGESTQKITKLVEPSPKIEIISLKQKSSTIQTADNVDYSQLGIYPQERYSWNTLAGIKGKERVIYCVVSINPIQYNTQENTITYAQNAEIKIKYTPPTQTKTFPDEYDLLILTPTEFQSTIQRFIDHKEGRGIRTKLVTLDEIPSTGVDTQESIKYFVREAIETWGVDYLILLGSGVEGSEKFPVRNAWIGSAPYEDYFPSDLYYADVYNGTGGFPDWDFDEDGKYAEYSRDKPDMDVIPDIHLGKIPCNTTSELDAYIDKVIWYDEHNKMTNKIVQIGGDTFPGDTQNVNEGEFANTKVMEKLPGYSTTELWASTGTLTKPNIANGYKKTLPDFFDFSGHGSPKSWATHPPNDDSVWIPDPVLIQPYGGWDVISYDIFNIKNSKKYPIIFHNACSNNKYSKTDNSLSWKVLKQPDGGGVIAFGASGIGLGGQGTGEVERVFGWMEVKTHEELYNTKNLGQVWTNAITSYYSTFESNLGKNDYKTMVEYSMFGDPTLNAQDGDDPRIRAYTNPYNNFFEGLLDSFPRFFRFLELLVGKIS